MSDEDDDLGNVITFPGTKQESKRVGGDVPDTEGKPIILTKENVFRLVKALSTIHLATTYKARKNDTCKENVRFANFPCKINCACYVNICSAMGLESFFGEEIKEEAELLVDAEHDLIKVIYKDLYDEDDDLEE